MSKYTTEVRFICENKSGLEISGGSGDVDSIIANSWNKIFTSKAPFFDEKYRSILCQKILKHYYLREICCETVGIWTLWMNTRLEEIMPYYNQLYESELIKFNPMWDSDYTRRHNRQTDTTTEDTEDRTQETTGSKTSETNDTKDITSKRVVDTTGNGNSTVNDTGSKTGSTTLNDTKYDLYSDTPQGALTGVDNEEYLTNARKVTDKQTGDSKEDTTSKQTGENSYTDKETDNYTENDKGNTTYTENTTGNLTGNVKNNGSANTTEDYIETVVGKVGTESYSSLLTKFRETFLNIDMQVIEEFNDLFFGLW